MNTLKNLLTCILLLGCLSARAKTCHEKIDSSGAYMFSHSVPIGNGMVECYVKAKDGTGTPSKATIAFTDEPKNDESSNECKLDSLKGEKLISAITSLMQRYTDEANEHLINDTKLATEESGHSGVGFFNGVYGSIVERLTANKVKDDMCLSKYIRPLSSVEQSKKGENNTKGSYPDFEGIGKSKGLQYDVTTASEAAKKPYKDGAKQKYIFLIYQRGLILDPKTGLAVKL